MNCTVYIATSLDGFIATKDRKVDFLMQIDNPTNDDFGFEKFINNIDAIIMGKNTFEFLLPFANQWVYSKPVYVMSSTLKEIPITLQDKAFLIQSDIDTLLNDLQNKGMNNFYIDGGKMIQSFLKKDLIDELIITQVPTLLGEGIPLFSNSGIKNFELVESELLLGQLVKSHYQIKR